VPVHVNLLDARGAGQEGAFNADAIAGDSSDGEGGIIGAAADDQDGTFENLNAFPVALSDPEMDADGITREVQGYPR